MLEPNTTVMRKEEEKAKAAASGRGAAHNRCWRPARRLAGQRE